MNTCPTCGYFRINHESTALVHSTNSVMVDGISILLTRTEMAIFEMLYRAMQRGNGAVHRDNLINAIYLLRADEPENAINLLRVFIHHLRKKLKNTNAHIQNHYDWGYSLVYEARKAA